MLGGLHDDVLVAQQGRLDVLNEQGLQGEGQVQADLSQLLTVLLSHFNALCCCRQALLTVKHLIKTKKITLSGQGQTTFTGFKILPLKNVVSQVQSLPAC